MDKNNYSFTSYHIGVNGDISYETISLDEDRRYKKMTIEALLEEIKQQVGTLLEELKKQVEALPDDEKKIRTLPIDGEKYTYIDASQLMLYTHTYPDVFDYSYDGDKENSSIGNYFKSEEDAEMVVRAMKLEQSIRLRRIELNDGWEPNWDYLSESKYYITYDYIGSKDVFVSATFGFHFLPNFGYYKSEKIAQQIIDEFENDLLWYFNEYYPNRDKMYVWGEKSND